MSPRYLLDTNICIYITKRHPSEVLKRFESLLVGDVVMSIITYGELQFGAGKSHSSRIAHENLERLVELIPVLSLPVSPADHYGRIRSALQRKGASIGGNDPWIAAHALAEDLILVSNNIKEFKRVAGLKSENWVKKT